MRTLAKITLTVALALSVSTAASANIAVFLTQIGGTYSATVGASVGDTLVLRIGFSITGAPSAAIIDPLIDLAGTATMDSFTETSATNWGSSSSSVNLGTAVVGDVKVSSGGIDGFDRVSGLNTVGAWGACLSSSGPANGFRCASMGTLSLTLTGLGGVIDTGSILQPTPFGTYISTGTKFGDTYNTDVTGTSSLGTFTIIPIPEPTTASLLGLGLLGLTVAGRSRKN
jgi:hypothetical protein